MTRLFGLGLTYCALTSVACAAPKDVHDFPAPSAHCVTAEPGRVLTSVGVLPYKWVRGSYEVVADTKIGPDPDDSRVLFHDPSITVYDDKCEVVWRQAYPGFGEIGFRVIDAPDQPLLHVVGRTHKETGEDQIFIHEILYPSSGSLQALAPTFLRTSRLSDTYIGQIPPRGELAIVVTINNWAQPLLPAPKRRENLTLLYHWRLFSKAGALGTYAFSGPKKIGPKALADLAIPADRGVPPFPLTDFMFGQ